MTGLLVAVGAAVGAPLRLLAGHHLDRRTHWGTLLVNLLGSLLLGWLVFGNFPGPIALLGIGVIVFAGVIMGLRQRVPAAVQPAANPGE